MVFTSPPEQKCPPAPVRITTRAVGSASISSSTPSSSRRMVRSSALRASGRFSLIVAIELARSTSRVWSPTVRSFPGYVLMTAPSGLTSARKPHRLAGRRARVGVDLQRGAARSEDRRVRLPALVDDVDDRELLLPRPFERVRDAPDRCGTAGQHDLAEGREILLLGVDHDQRGVR